MVAARYGKGVDDEKKKQWICGIELDKLCVNNFRVLEFDIDVLIAFVDVF